MWWRLRGCDGRLDESARMALEKHRKKRNQGERRMDKGSCQIVLKHHNCEPHRTMHNVQAGMLGLWDAADRLQGSRCRNHGFGIIKAEGWPQIRKQREAARAAARSRLGPVYLYVYVYCATYRSCSMLACCYMTRNGSQAPRLENLNRG